MHLRTGTFLLTLALCTTACVGAPIQSSDEFSPRRYRDTISLNDRCPNTGTALNPKVEPIWVNARPIGFC